MHFACLEEIRFLHMFATTYLQNAPSPSWYVTVLAVIITLEESALGTVVE